MKKTFALAEVVAALGVTMAMVTLAPGASATQANVAAADCRAYDDTGGLDRDDITFGECLNRTTEAASESAYNYWAAACGFDATQHSTQTTNKGQCIKAVRKLFP